MTVFKGSGVALVTPFKDNEINLVMLEELIEWHIKNKTDAIIICGTTGESATLSTEEKKRLIDFTVKSVKGRIPVIAGTGSNNTITTLELSKYAEKVGVDGLLIVTPYYNKTTQKGLIKHYVTIADEVNVPIILYSVKGRTSLNIEPETVRELSMHRNIVGIKEASGDMSQVVRIASQVDDDFSIYAGNDDQIVPVLSVGGSGVISVVANLLPEMTHKLVNNYFVGNTKQSKDIQLRLNELINTLFIETNPVPVKAALNLMNIDVGSTRLPLIKMSDQHEELLRKRMNELGIIPKE